MLEKIYETAIVKAHFRNYVTLNKRILKNKYANFNHSITKNLLFVPNIISGKLQNKKNAIIDIHKYNSSINMNLSRNYNNISSLKEQKSSFNNNNKMVLENISYLQKNSKSPVQIDNFKKKKLIKFIKQPQFLTKNTINLNDSDISCIKKIEHFPEISIVNTKHKISIKKKEKNFFLKKKALKDKKPKINENGWSLKEVINESNNNNFCLEDINNFFWSNVIERDDKNSDYRKKMIDFNEKLNLQLHHLNDDKKTKLKLNDMHLPLINSSKSNNLTINVDKNCSKNRKEKSMNISLRTKFIDDKEKLEFKKNLYTFKNSFCSNFLTTPKQIDETILTQETKETNQKFKHSNKLFNKNRINKDLENSKEEYNSFFNDNDNKINDS